MKRMAWVMGAMAMAAAVTASESEFSRTLFTRENRLPELNRWELGLFSQYVQYDESLGVSGLDWKRKDFTVGPYARYGLYENLTAYAAVPFGHVDSDRTKDTHTGIRDITLGMELLAYEYTFGYPYIIPYVEVILPTGDEDDKLGNGKTDAVFGASAGTTVYDVYNYILDARYNVNHKNSGDEDEDGMFTLAAAFIWDLNERFALMAEAKGTSEDIAGESGIPLYFRGGMNYKVSDQLSLSWFGGGAVNSDEDGMGAIKVGYLF